MEDKTYFYISKCEKTHGNKYDYSLITSVFKRECKVTIICQTHGSFIQSLHKHIGGDGCPKCGIDRQKSTRKTRASREFIEKANIIHENRYDYSCSNYLNAKTKLTVICKKHGDFTITPNLHLSSKKGCGVCLKEKIISDKWDKYKMEFDEIHNNYYDYSKVIWKTLDTNITVICPNHGEFAINGRSHIRGRGCKKCVKKEPKHKSTDFFIKKARDKWGDTYDYSISKYTGADNYVEIICNKHGIFKQIPGNHYKYGCGKCGNENSPHNLKLNEESREKFRTNATKIHGNKYDYSKFIYVNSTTKGILICKKHGNFEQSPNGHLSGKGCGKCASEKNGRNRTKQLDDYLPKYLSAWKNKYDYSQVKWISGTKHIEIICPKHGSFWMLPYIHVKKECSKCTLIGILFHQLNG